MDPELIRQMNALRNKREAEGQNVRFIDDCGREDCWSFASRDAADNFRQKVKAKGYTILN